MKKINNKPIGVLDSGVGGLTVVKEIFRQLPQEEIVYFGDTARCPYGPRPTEEVRNFTFEIVDFLLQHNVKMIVIACNTATAAALEAVKHLISLPVIGVIQPGSIAAIKNTKTGKIGVIGTEGTIASKAYDLSLKRINPLLTITSLACPTLVPLVENGQQSPEVIRSVVKDALEPIQNEEMDALIMGCTHYPIISEYIQEVIGENVKLLSSAEETAREVSAILHFQNIMSNYANTPVHRFFTTSDDLNFKRIGEQWLGRSINVEHIELVKSR